jgi:uncharacterized membrane protein
LLVLEIAVPAGSQHDLLGAFLNQWPSYLAYVVSFSTIGALWLEHSLITEYLDQADAILVRLNLLLLLVVSFLPFPTRLLAEYLNSDNAERVAVSIYGLTLLVALSLLSVLWRYAVRAHLARTDMTDDELTALTRRLTRSGGLRCLAWAWLVQANHCGHWIPGDCHFLHRPAWAWQTAQGRQERRLTMMRRPISSFAGNPEAHIWRY